VGAARSQRRVAEQMLRLMAQVVGERPIAASTFHAGAPEKAAWLGEMVQERFHCREFFITEFTPVMGVHTGPGTFGVGYWIHEP